MLFPTLQTYPSSSDEPDDPNCLFPSQYMHSGERGRILKSPIKCIEVAFGAHSR